MKNRSLSYRWRKRAAQNRRGSLRKATLDRLKVERGCERCGFRGEACQLDWDHRDPKQKSFCLTHRAQVQRPMPSLLAEAMKCQVLCANCHRLRHHQERGGRQLELSFPVSVGGNWIG